MKNITVATRKNVGYYNIMVKSCKKHNIDLVILGLNQKWKGFSMKFRLWKEYITKLPDDEIIMINDAYDVIIVEDANNILSKFKKMNKKIVFGDQTSRISKMFFVKCPFTKIMCSGNIIGYVKYIKQMIQFIFKYQHIWKQFNYDDQIILGEICKRELAFFKKNTMVDTNKSIFFVTSSDNLLKYQYLSNGYIENLTTGNKKLIYKKTQKPISILHLASNVNGNYYLQYLGYDISKIKSVINRYKIRQTIDLVKLLLQYKITKIILLIVIVFLIIIVLYY